MLFSLRWLFPVTLLSSNPNRELQLGSREGAAVQASSAVTGAGCSYHGEAFFQGSLGFERYRTPVQFLPA